jgi:hypothetical protein
MKALLSALVITFGLNAQATTPLVKKMQNFISDEKNQEMFYECSFHDHYGYDEGPEPECTNLNSRYIAKLAKAAGVSFKALEKDEVPFDVKYEIKKQNFNSSCKRWTSCSYESPDGEYGYSKSLEKVYLFDNRIYLALYSGFGGEWADESADLFFYIIDENMKQVSRQSFETWAE